MGSSRTHTETGLGTHGLSRMQNAFLPFIRHEPPVNLVTVPLCPAPCVDDMTEEPAILGPTMGYYATTSLPRSACTPETANPRAARAVSGSRFYRPSLGRWVNRDPITTGPTIRMRRPWDSYEPKLRIHGQRRLETVATPANGDEEANAYLFTRNTINAFDALGLMASWFPLQCRCLVRGVQDSPTSACNLGVLGSLATIAQHGECHAGVRGDAKGEKCCKDYTCTMKRLFRCVAGEFIEWDIGIVYKIRIEYVWLPVVKWFQPACPGTLDYEERYFDPSPPDYRVPMQ